MAPAGITSRPPGISNYGLPGPEPSLRATNEEYLAQRDHEESRALISCQRYIESRDSRWERPFPYPDQPTLINPRLLNPAATPFIAPGSSSNSSSPDSGIIGPAPDPRRNLSTHTRSESLPLPVSAYLEQQPSRSTRQPRSAHIEPQHIQRAAFPLPTNTYLSEHHTESLPDPPTGAFEQQLELVDLLNDNRHQRRNSFIEAQREVGSFLPSRASKSPVRDFTERDRAAANRSRAQQPTSSTDPEARHQGSTRSRVKQPTSSRDSGARHQGGTRRREQQITSVPERAHNEAWQIPARTSPSPPPRVRRGSLVIRPPLGVTRRPLPPRSPLSQGITSALDIPSSESQPRDSENTSGVSRPSTPTQRDYKGHPSSTTQPASPGNRIHLNQSSTTQGIENRRPDVAEVLRHPEAYGVPSLATQQALTGRPEGFFYRNPDEPKHRQ